MFKLRNLVLIAAVVTLTGCSAFTESVIAVGSLGSATWNLLTGWIPGVGGEEVVATEVVTSVVE